MRRPLILLAATALGGCSLAPHYARRELPVPPSWPIGDVYLRQSEATLPTITYAQVFTDPRLQRIVERALVNNRDLRVAFANIQAARAQYRIQRADLLPQIDATGRYTYSGSGTGGNTNGAGTGNGAGGTTGTGAITSNSRSSSFFSVGIGTTAFELDLFGRVKSLTGAALNRYFGTEAAARATRLTLVGDIADQWLQLAADRSLLRIAQDTAATTQITVRLTRARLEGGIAPRTDLTQAQTILAIAQSDLAQQRTLVAQDGNALQLLVGAPIEGALLPASIEEAAPTLATLPAGLDSGILLRRPDVVQSEYELRATNAEIGAARAALFPRISLTSFVGFASTALSTLFSGGAFNYSAGPSIDYPIFRRGAARANVRFSQAQRDIALANYERTIQTAFRETADALARQGTIADQLSANKALQAAAADTLTLTTAAYRGGVQNFLNTLDAQRTFYNAQRSLAQTQLIGASNRVALYRALGGDATLEATDQGPRTVGASGAPRIEPPLPGATPPQR